MKGGWPPFTINLAEGAALAKCILPYERSLTDTNVREGPRGKAQFV